MTYNYARFETKFYDLASFEGPKVGYPMPDLKLNTIEGDLARLSDLTEGVLVLETGSVTCPMYAKGVKRMQALAARFPDVLFAVLYVREAHPGGRVGPHRSIEEKRQRASSLDEVHNDHRLVLIDNLEGTAHRALGSLPDMIYVVGPDGLVQFRGDWNDPGAVEKVLTGEAGEALIAQEHFPPAKPNVLTTIRTLMVGGPTALWDFVLGLPGLLRLHRKADRAYQ